MSRRTLGVRCHARCAPSFRRPDKNHDNALNRVLYTYDDLSRSDASLPTSLVSSITYVMRCRRYVMTMTRRTRRTIGGIAVTVSMPHRFPYGLLLLFFLSSLYFLFIFFFASRTHRHRRSYRSIVIVAPGFYEAHCISIGPRGLVVAAVAVILKATTGRFAIAKRGPTLAILRRQLFGLPTAIPLARGAAQRCFFLARLYDGLRKRGNGAVA